VTLSPEVGEVWSCCRGASDGRIGHDVCEMMLEVFAETVVSVT
jgi:hypothetical protein